VIATSTALVVQLYVFQPAYHHHHHQQQQQQQQQSINVAVFTERLSLLMLGIFDICL
jgi:hypothetical protein